jgi:hypothetical protein
MLDEARDRTGAGPGSARAGGAVPASPASRPAGLNETAASLPDVCPNCGRSERELEPFIDENGTRTNLLTVLCTGCGYRFGEIAEPPAGAEAEDAEKSLAILPSSDLGD